jgi:hypothetical protein
VAIIKIAIVIDYPSLWLHIDAAWAGSALSCPEYRDMCHLEEINAVATSFCTNFHKVLDPQSYSLVTHQQFSSGASPILISLHYGLGTANSSLMLWTSRLRSCEVKRAKQVKMALFTFKHTNQQLL